MRLPVFPSTKFAVIVRGLGPLWMMVCREQIRSAGVNEKNSYDVGSKFTRGRPFEPCSTVSGV